MKNQSRQNSPKNINLSNTQFDDHKRDRQVFSLETMAHVIKGDLDGMENENINGDQGEMIKLDMDNISAEEKAKLEYTKNIFSQTNHNTSNHLNISQDDIQKNKGYDINSNDAVSPLPDNQNVQFHDKLEDIQKNGISQRKPEFKESDSKLKDDAFTTKAFSTSQSVIGEDYFKQDAEMKIQDQYNRAKADITAFKSYFVKFRFCQFFEFSFYHILFYVVLGPFTSLIIRFFGKSLPHNLLFSYLSMSLFYQTLFFLFTFLTYVLYYLMDCPHIYFQSEVMFVIAVVISRCLVIAFKYATFDPVKIQVIRNHNLKYEEIFADFYLVDWANQTDRIIHDETYFGLRAYDIDPSMFYVDFMVDPDYQRMQNAEQYVEDLKKYHVSKSTPFMPENVNRTRDGVKCIFGYSIMKEFSIVFKERNKFIYKNIYYFCQGYGILRSLIPIITRLIEGSYPQDYYWQEYIIMLGVAWNSRQIYFYSILQLMNGFLDIKRQVFQQNQLAFMMAPRKLRNLDCYKIYPTINIFKMSTLKGWQLIRQVCLEFGKSYFLRVQALFGSFFLISVTLVVVLALGIFKVVKLENSMIAIIISDIVMFLVLILMLCYYCAKANDIFRIYENILKGNKSIISDIYRNRHKYFQENSKSSNYIYNKGIEKIKDESKHLKGMDPITYTLELIRDYEDQIQDLIFDSTNNPVTILGVKITFGLLQSICITLAGVIVTLAANSLKSFIK